MMRYFVLLFLLYSVSPKSYASQWFEVYSEGKFCNKLPKGLEPVEVVKKRTGTTNLDVRKSTFYDGATRLTINEVNHKDYVFDFVTMHGSCVALSMKYARENPELFEQMSKAASQGDFDAQFVMQYLQSSKAISKSSLSISKEAEYLGLPRITTKEAFIQYFGSCDNDEPDSPLPPNVASTCVVKNNESCSDVLGVGNCNLVRYGFDNKKELSFVFLSLSGKNAITIAHDRFAKIHGESKNKQTSQSSGYARFDFSWKVKDVVIELQNLFSISQGNANSSENAGLIWIGKK